MNKLPLLVRVGLVLAFLPLLGAFLPPHAVAAEQLAMSFAPDADSLVKQLFPGKNYGTFPQLRTDGFPIVHSYLRFSVHGLGGLPVAKAQLQIYANSGSRIGISAAAVSSNYWEESTITYNTAPALGPTLSESGPFLPGTRVPLDVSSYISGEGTFSFGITTSGITAINLASREAGGDIAPRLVVLLGNPDTPVASFTPVLPDTPTLAPMPPATETPTVVAPTPAPDTATATLPPVPITDTPISSPTPSASDTPTLPAGPSGSIQHVFIVVMENKGYDQVWNTSSSPYITQLGNSYVRATNYHALTHPSLPNYLDLISGSNYSITNDCLPSSNCHISAQSLVDSLEARGLTWRGYMESMPLPCTLTNSGQYAPRHNPFVYFDNISSNAVRCATQVLPYNVLPLDLLSSATTPNFALISPDVCNDMHDCSIRTGDTWLQNNLPLILNSPACVSERCLLVLVWDEDDGGESNRVLAIFAGSGAKTGGLSSSAPYDHFSLLRTVESIFGLPVLTSNDANATPMLDMLP